MPELPTSASVRFGVSMLAAEELALEGFFLRLRFLTRLKEFIEICEIVKYKNSTSADSQLALKSVCCSSDQSLNSTAMHES